MKNRYIWQSSLLLLLTFLFLPGCANQLLNAAYSGNLSKIESLIKDGQDLNQPAVLGGTTALHMASSSGRLDAARLLIDKGANIDIQNTDGLTPLHWAIIFRKTDMARLLMQRGARLDIQDKNGLTALHHATVHGNEDIVRLLIESGARLDTQSPQGMTALHIVAKLGKPEIARLLIENGANTNIRNIMGLTALDLSLAANSYSIADMLRDQAVQNQPPRTEFQPKNIIPTYKTYTGTGWVTEGGFIVTNHHVIEGHVQIMVRFNTLGGAEFPANVVLSDKFNDLAVLSIPYYHNFQLGS